MWLFADISTCWCLACFYSNAASGKHTWLYEYQYRASFLKYESWVNGSHVDDCYTVFGEPFMETFRSVFLRTEWNDDDRAMAALHQKYFANFAYTGCAIISCSIAVLQRGALWLSPRVHSQYKETDRLTKKVPAGSATYG